MKYNCLFVGYFRKSVNLLILLILLILIGFQIDAEVYRKKIDIQYSFFENRKRISYKPFFWFYIQSRGLREPSYNIYWDSINLPYEQKDLFGKDKVLLFNIQYNAYFLYCYYTREELEYYQMQKKIIVMKIPIARRSLIYNAV